MIPSKVNVESDVEGLESKRLSMVVNSKSFKVMIDGLYTDKPQSICRELWTNALDSHIAAGIADQPFHCQLPTQLDPTFLVRDYGTSMDHDTMFEVYTQLFNSSKDESNEQTGYLGLGSKTPFSYTDAYSVIAFLNGERRVYAMAMGNDGVPELTLLKREPTDQPNGIEVSFAVQQYHINDFLVAAQRVAMGFDVVPTTNIEDFTDALPEPVFSAEGFKVYENWSSFNNGAWVRQGPVLYPVPRDVSYHIPNEYRNLIKVGHFFVFDVPMGTVDFTASREALQLTDDTRQALALEMTTGLAALRKLAMEDVEGQKSLMKALLTYGRWSEFLHLPDMEYKGRTIKASRHNLIPFTTNGPSPDFYRTGGRGLVKVHPSDNGELYFPIRDLPNLEFYVHNPKEKVPRKRKRFMEYAGSKSHVFWLENVDGKAISRMMRILELDIKQFKKVSDLPDVDPPERSRSGPATGLYRTEIGTSSRYLHHTKITEIDDNLKYYWMPIEKATNASEIDMSAASGRYWHVRFDSREHFLEPMKIVGEFIEYRPLIFMTPRAQKRYAPDDSNRFDLVLRSAFEAAKDAVVAMIERDTWNYLPYSRHNIYGLRSTLMAQLEDDDDADNQLTDKQRELLSSIVRYTDNSTEFPEFQAARKNAEVRATEIARTYPMLFSPNENHMRNYIDMVNAMKKEDEADND